MDRRTLLKAGMATTAGGLIVPVGGSLTAEAAAKPRVQKVLAKDLRVPWGLAFLPNGNALVGERDTGRILLVRKTGGFRVVGKVPGVVGGISVGGEGGLLGLALHPNFRRNRWLYAFMSSGSDNRVVRMKFQDGKLGPVRVIKKGIPKAVHHNGGGLAFKDGLLYVSTGDAENPGAAQDRRSLAGKVLRMTDTGRVPRGNPFGNYTWSYGHRNPEQITFTSSGKLWSSEFGEKDKDELNRIVKGGNYGWPFHEGKDGGDKRYRDPLAAWDTDICSPSGIAIAGGRAWLGALRGQCLWAVRLNGPNRGKKQRYFTGKFGRIRTVAAAPDGSLWICTSNRDGRANPGPNDDRIIRVRLR